MGQYLYGSILNRDIGFDCKNSGIVGISLRGFQGIAAPGGAIEAINNR